SPLGVACWHPFKKLTAVSAILFLLGLAIRFSKTEPPVLPLAAVLPFTSASRRFSPAGLQLLFESALAVNRFASRFLLASSDFPAPPSGFRCFFRRGARLLSLRRLPCQPLLC